MLKIFAESRVPATKALRESKIEIIGTELPYLLSAEEEGLWSSSRLKDLHFYIKEIYFLSFIYFLQLSTKSYALHCYVFPRAGNSFSLFLRHCHIVLDHFVWTEFATNGIKRDVGDPLVVMLAPQML